MNFDIIRGIVSFYICFYMRWRHTHNKQRGEIDRYICARWENFYFFSSIVCGGGAPTRRRRRRRNIKTYKNLLRFFVFRIGISTTRNYCVKFCFYSLEDFFDEILRCVKCVEFFSSQEIVLCWQGVATRARSFHILVELRSMSNCFYYQWHVETFFFNLACWGWLRNIFSPLNHWKLIWNIIWRDIYVISII